MFSPAGWPESKVRWHLSHRTHEPQTIFLKEGLDSASDVAVGLERSEGPAAITQERLLDAARHGVPRPLKLLVELAQIGDDISGIAFR